MALKKVKIFNTLQVWKGTFLTNSTKHDKALTSVETSAAVLQYLKVDPGISAVAFPILITLKNTFGEQQLKETSPRTADKYDIREKIMNCL